MRAGSNPVLPSIFGFPLPIKERVVEAALRAVRMSRDVLTAQLTRALPAWYDPSCDLAEYHPAVIIFAL